MKLLMLLVAAGWCVSCSNKGAFLPPSGGKSGEVVVLSQQQTAAHQVQNILAAVPAGVLPQPEPAFTVLISPQSAKAVSQKARCLVVVHIDAHLPQSSIQLAEDVYAQPQYVVKVNLKHQQLLQQSHIQKRLIAAVQQAQNKLVKRNLAQHRNLPMQQKVQQLFDIDMLIPADMDASKTGKQFIWISNNTAQGLKNLCIYKLQHINHLRTMAFRDSVMKQNILGEQNNQWVETVVSSCRFSPSANTQQAEIMVEGLWEMRNDAMGGPFVMRMLKTPNGWLVAEGFVFAPEMKKRELMRQLKTCLYTINLQHYGQSKNTRGHNPR